METEEEVTEIPVDGARPRRTHQGSACVNCEDADNAAPKVQGGILASDRGCNLMGAARRHQKQWFYFCYHVRRELPNGDGPHAADVRGAQ